MWNSSTDHSCCCSCPSFKSENPVKTMLSLILLTFISYFNSSTMRRYFLRRTFEKGFINDLNSPLLQHKIFYYAKTISENTYSLLQYLWWNISGRNKYWLYKAPVTLGLFDSSLNTRAVPREGGSYLKCNKQQLFVMSFLRS